MSLIAVYGVILAAEVRRAILEQLIQVKGLSRDYKVAKRDGGFLKFMFSRRYELIHAVNSIDFSIQNRMNKIRRDFIKRA